jgi:hypothetical protein
MFAGCCSPAVARKRRQNPSNVHILNALRAFTKREGIQQHIRILNAFLHSVGDTQHSMCVCVCLYVGVLCPHVRTKDSIENMNLEMDVVLRQAGATQRRQHPTKVNIFDAVLASRNEAVSNNKFIFSMLSLIRSGTHSTVCVCACMCVCSVRPTEQRKASKI